MDFVIVTTQNSAISWVRISQSLYNKYLSEIGLIRLIFAMHVYPFDNFTGNKVIMAMP